MRAIAVLALCALSCSGCYFSVQRTSYVMKTEAVDESDNMPSADMSMASNIYEIAAGATVWRADLFGGVGIGTKRVHQRSATTATEPDEVGGATRYFLGAVVTAFATGRLRIRPYGILSGGFTFLSEDFENEVGVLDSRVTRGWEGGVEIAFDVLRDLEDIGTGSAFVRFGYARMRGKTVADFFGSERWEGNAVLASFGFALGLGGL